MVAEAPTSPAQELTIPDALPVLPLRGGMVVLPLAAMPLIVGQPRSVQLIDDIMRQDRLLVLVAQRTEHVDEPTPDDLHPGGTGGFCSPAGAPGRCPPPRGRAGPRGGAICGFRRARAVSGRTKSTSRT